MKIRQVSLILFVLCLCLLRAASGAADEGPILGFEWGDSPDAVVKRLEARKWKHNLFKTSEAGDMMISCYNVEILGHRGDIILFIDGNKLDMLSVSYPEDADKKIHGDLMRQFTAKYGKPEPESPEGSGDEGDSWTIPDDTVISLSHERTPDDTMGTALMFVQL